MFLREPYQTIAEPEVYRDWVFTMQGVKKINYIRNVDPMAYAHLVESFRLLQAVGYYTESIL